MSAALPESFLKRRAYADELAACLVRMYDTDAAELPRSESLTTAYGALSSTERRDIDYKAPEVIVAFYAAPDACRALNDALDRRATRRGQLALPDVPR